MAKKRRLYAAYRYARAAMQLHFCLKEPFIVNRINYVSSASSRVPDYNIKKNQRIKGENWYNSDFVDNKLHQCQVTPPN